ncbi:MAG: hypothetical protein KBD66_04315 [Candidatus Doudnabacteria bacterium]|nr:hypothetical protein [Candidatus Doudnabacteria bacterium]
MASPAGEAGVGVVCKLSRVSTLDFAKSPKIRSPLPKLASGKHSEVRLGNKILSNL